MARQSGTESGRRLLTILFCFTPERPVWTVSDLASAAKLPVSSVYRYVSLLREENIVDPAGPSSYRLTDRVIALAQAAQAGQAPLIEVSRPHIEELAHDLDETVLVVRRGGRVAYCVDRVEPSRPVRLQFNRGQAMAIHQGSASRVLLAHMPLAERAAYLASLDLEGLPHAHERLSEVGLDRIVAEGWTESFEEVDEGIWGAAAAIYSGDEAVAALGTAGPMYRLNAQRRKAVIQQVRDAAAKISAGLAGRY